MIYIDTGAFFARFAKKDQHHIQAMRIWKKIYKQNVKLVSSNFVIDETLTLLARKTSYEYSVEQAKNIYNSPTLTLLRPEKSDEIAAIKLFEKYADMKVSFTDCVSFQLMKKHKINKAFTFDMHFQLAGFDAIK